MTNHPIILLAPVNKVPQFYYRGRLRDFISFLAYLKAAKP